jgi:hypothetical protein
MDDFWDRRAVRRIVCSSPIQISVTYNDGNVSRKGVLNNALEKQVVGSTGEPHSGQ